MALPTYGSMAVDWENRIDFDRLRRATRTTSWHEPDIRNLHLVTYLLHVDTHPPCPRNLL